MEHKPVIAIFRTAFAFGCHAKWRASVAELCRRLGEVLSRVATQYEIILVNDGGDLIILCARRQRDHGPPPESGGPLRPEQREFL